MAAATPAEAEACMPMVVDSMEAPTSTAVDTVAVIVADFMADFTVAIPEAPMADTELLSAHAVDTVVHAAPR
jgi:hypothetical protein